MYFCFLFSNSYTILPSNIVYFNLIFGKLTATIFNNTTTRAKHSMVTKCETNDNEFAV